jgi:glucose/arabinose dehydrogenase
MKFLNITRTIKLGLVVATAVAGLSVSQRVAFAQGGDAPPLPGDLVAGDLASPRGLAFDAAGNLLVAVAGTGGDAELTTPSTEGGGEAQTIKAGLTGSIMSIDKDGKASTLLPGFPSYAGGFETTGIYRVIPQGDSLWVLLSTAGPTAAWGSNIVEYDAKTFAVKRTIALYPFEAANNPDGNELDSNVSDIAWTADGTLLITDAGANALLSWTEADGLKVVTAWPDNSVPTSVEVAANGDVYVGFLGAGLAPGAGKVEVWAEGKLKETFANLNTVTDILLDGETLYAVQLTIMGEQGPGAGSVVTVDANGATPVAEGLMAPFGIAKGPDGSLYVSFGTIAFQPGMTGGIVKLK